MAKNARVTREPFSLAEYFNRMLVFPHAALSPDGKRLAYISSVSGSPQVWTAEVPRAGMLRYPKPVTSSKSQRPYVFERALAWLGPDLLAIVFETDGDECTFIEILNLKTGEIIPIPRGEGKSRDFLGFAEIDRVRGPLLYLSSNRANPRVQALYRFSLANRELTLIYQDASHSAAWSSGVRWKKQYLFSLTTSNVSNRLMACNASNGQVTTLFDAPDTFTTAVAGLAGNRILVTSSYGQEFIGPAILEVSKKAGNSRIKFLLGELGRDLWDRDVTLSPDHKNLLVNENRAGESVLTLYAWPSLKKRKIQPPRGGMIDTMSFSRDGRSILIAHQSSVNPRDFYRMDVRSGKAEALTDNYVSRVPRPSLVEPKPIRYRLKNPLGEREIYSWFFLPQGARQDASLPVIIWPHGGPQWQERPQQRPVFQFLLSRGFAIWAPNHRGSTGFGKTCAKSIERAWGTADLPDLAGGITWLKQSGWIDPDRIAIMGGSYGGYMTLRAITRLPEVFRVAVDIFGVVNLLTMTQSMPEDWKPYTDRLIGNPEKDRAMLIEQSPFFELDRVRCPLLVIQGKNDPRVTPEESEQVVASLRQRNHPVEYLLFPDEGHGFFKLENEIAAYTKAAEFIEKYLGSSR